MKLKIDISKCHSFHLECEFLDTYGLCVLHLSVLDSDTQSGTTESFD